MISLSERCISVFVLLSCCCCKYGQSRCFVWGFKPHSVYIYVLFCANEGIDSNIHGCAPQLLLLGVKGRSLDLLMQRYDFYFIPQSGMEKIFALIRNFFEISLWSMSRRSSQGCIWVHMIALGAACPCRMASPECFHVNESTNIKREKSTFSVRKLKC